jgi:hypothetical protein
MCQTITQDAKELGALLGEEDNEGSETIPYPCPFTPKPSSITNKKRKMVLSALKVA